MIEVTSFERTYNDARIHFNTKRGKKNPNMKNKKSDIFRTTTDVEPVDTTNLHVLTLATVTLMLVHNLERKHPSGLNIDTLQTYDLNTFQDYAMFDPYVDYLLYKRYGSQDKVHSKSFYATYNTMMVRYLWIAQSRKVKAIHL